MSHTKKFTCHGPTADSSRITILTLVLLAFPVAMAYDTYSTTSSSVGNCADCHGGFRVADYKSKVDNSAWNNNLHDVHRNTMLNGDCDVCHSGTSRRPVYLGSSAGGTGLSPYSCAGCHGRSQDGTTPGTTKGFGAGLRQRHYRAGRTVCATCHADANPASKTPVAENVKPPYYASPGTNHPAIPSDPCNPSPAYVENFAGSTLGLDNDGNGKFDLADGACVTGSTPGETGRSSQLLVTKYDKLSGRLTISYGPSCSATDNSVDYGQFGGLSSYTYSGQVCAIGNTGVSSFTLPAGSLYFLVVGRNSQVEGSYGTSSSGAELPPNPAQSCPMPQNLSHRCD